MDSFGAPFKTHAALQSTGDSVVSILDLLALMPTRKVRKPDEQQLSEHFGLRQPACNGTINVYANAAGLVYVCGQDECYAFATDPANVEHALALLAFTANKLCQQSQGSTEFTSAAAVTESKKQRYHFETAKGEWCDRLKAVADNIASLYDKFRSKYGDRFAGMLAFKAKSGASEVLYVMPAFKYTSQDGKKWYSVPFSYIVQRKQYYVVWKGEGSDETLSAILDVINTLAEEYREYADQLKQTIHKDVGVGLFVAYREGQLIATPALVWVTTQQKGEYHRVYIRIGLRSDFPNCPLKYLATPGVEI